MEAIEHLLEEAKVGTGRGGLMFRDMSGDVSFLDEVADENSSYLKVDLQVSRDLGH